MKSMNILHGDAETLLKGMGNETVHLTMTSPPYYNAKEYVWYSSVEEYMEKMKKVFVEVHRITKESRMCVVNVSPILVPRERRQEASYRVPIPFHFVVMMESIGWEFLEDIIWKKPDGAAKLRGRFHLDRKPLAYKPNLVTEYILVFKKKCDRLIDRFIENRSLIVGDFEQTNVWEFNPETDSQHPAPFPFVLAEKIIRYYSYEGDLVLDPFAGSGTTGLASYHLKRSFVGCEIHEEYILLAKSRTAHMIETEKVNWL